MVFVASYLGAVVECVQWDEVGPVCDQAVCQCIGKQWRAVREVSAGVWCRYWI